MSLTSWPKPVYVSGAKSENLGVFKPDGTNREDKDKLRSSVLAETITRLYDTSFASWKKMHPEEYYEVCREVAVLLEYQAKRMSNEDGFADVFTQFRDEERSTPDLLEQIAAEAGLSEKT